MRDANSTLPSLAWLVGTSGVLRVLFLPLMRGLLGFFLHTSFVIRTWTLCTLVPVLVLDILSSGAWHNHCVGTRCLVEIELNSIKFKGPWENQPEIRVNTSREGPPGSNVQDFSLSKLLCAGRVTWCHSKEELPWIFTLKHTVIIESAGTLWAILAEAALYVILWKKKPASTLLTAYITGISKL